MHDTTEGQMLAAALAWHDAGCSVVRVATDGTKAPDGAWKQYQHQPAGRDTVAAWFASEHPGLGVIAGAASGDLEMFELEGRAAQAGLIERLVAQLAADGHPDLFARIVAGYSETTPGGGIHVLYRVAGGVDGNTKLARRPGEPDSATGRPRVDVLAETRGEGGFVVVAPSRGTVHPSGGAWRTVSGSPADLVTITAAERDALHLAARALDQMPPPPPMPDPPVLDRERRPGEISPGDDYNQRAEWATLLGGHGWTLARAYTDRAYWTRPGKSFGISAVTGGDQGDYLYVWTTSTELPAEQAMSKWRVYALLEHGGDFSAAASALRRKGYGSPLPEPTRPVLTVLPTINVGTAAVAVEAAENMPADIPAAATTLAHSDDALALELVDRFGQHVRYVSERGRWLHWTGRRWEWCPPGGGVVREYVKALARNLPDETKPDARHKQRALSAIGTTAALTQAQTDKRIVVQLDQLDARPYELNTPEGIVDLRTGELLAADPGHLHTRITSVAPDTDTDPARWLNFLDDTFHGHDELPGYVQRLVGYSVTGVVREHVLPFCFGAGANGKGVFLETLRAVLGDYATTAPSGFLMAKNYAGHETEIARLAGARMVVCSEVNEGDRFDEAKVKMLTGGDTLTARFMRMDHFTFVPTHKLWLMGNHQPTVTGGGHSFWRRTRIVPFVNTVPEHRRVEDLQGILAAEHGPAVLAWVIAGAVDYFAAGLREPQSVKDATAEYAHEQDTVSRFVEDVCQLGGAPLVQIRTSVVREAYERWCHSEGVEPVKANVFGRTLSNRFGIVRKKSNGVPYYLGITVLDGESLSLDRDRLDLQ